jgi:hypothetical protein
VAQHKKRGKPKTEAPPPADVPEALLRTAFLDHLSTSGNISESCTAAKLPRRTAYNWRNADKDFAKAWEEAKELGTDALEDEAVRRAREGSDTLLIFMLKSLRPDKFKDRVASEHSGPGGKPIEFMNADDRRARITELLERARARGIVTALGGGGSNGAAVDPPTGPADDGVQQ